MLLKIYLDQKLSLSLCPGNNWGVLPLGPSSLHKQELVISVQQHFVSPLAVSPAAWTNILPSESPYFPLLA